MTPEEFRRYAHQVVDHMADYMGSVEQFPVRAQMLPGGVESALPLAAPEQPESMDEILKDVGQIVRPGLTHWQHPRFFAYFQANGSPPSLLAEMLTAAFGQQAMLWETSPAANELEARVMEWLRQLIDLPDSFTGTIQDSGSTSNLVALLVARERALDWRGNEEGLSGVPAPVAYVSQETHSSVAKAARIAGYGGAGTVAVATDARHRMDVRALERAIVKDRERGRVPAVAVATFGTTGVGAMDSISDMADVCEEHGVFLHVDASWAGSALILPEVQAMARGLYRAHSLVLNPHKWLLTHFDCSAFYVKWPKDLLRTLRVSPAYLESDAGEGGREYRDWTIPLGRRFRALKLWFVLRSYGAEALRGMIRRHVQWAANLERTVAAEPDFEVVTPRSLSLFTFRFRAPGMDDVTEVDRLNLALLEMVNSDGFTYLTRTDVDGRPVIRFVVGQLWTEERHVTESWSHITRIARSLHTVRTKRSPG